MFGILNITSDSEKVTMDNNIINFIIIQYTTETNDLIYDNIINHVNVIE